MIFHSKLLACHHFPIIYPLSSWSLSHHLSHQYHHDFPIIHLSFTHHSPIIYLSFTHHLPIIDPSFTYHLPIIDPSFTHHWPIIYPSFTYHWPIIYPSFTYHFPLKKHHFDAGGRPHRRLRRARRRGRLGRAGGGALRLGQRHGAFGADGKIMGTSWDFYGISMGKFGFFLGKNWNSHGKKLEFSWEKIGIFMGKMMGKWWDKSWFSMGTWWDNHDFLWENMKKPGGFGVRKMGLILGKRMGTWNFDGIFWWEQKPWENHDHDRFFVYFLMGKPFKHWLSMGFFMDV